MAKPSVFVKLTAKPGKRDELVAAFAPMLGAVADEAGTEVYSVHLDNKDEDVAWIFEMYADEDALAVHSSSETMKALGAAFGELLADVVLTMTTAQSGKGLPL
jgi:quinol monooxygenase YgiN